MTQETEDVVGRLRLFGSARPQLGLPVCDEAADLLERLSDRIDVLAGLLRRVHACRMEAGEGRFVNLSKLRNVMADIDAALHQEGIEP